MIPTPHVTCIVATHLRPTTLPRALDSLLAQTYRDFEIIVIHDGPPDEETKQLFLDYDKRCDEANIPFKAASTNEKSGYYCQPRNMALTQLAPQGDYIYHLDDDNAATPSALKIMVEAIREGVVWPDFVYGQINYKFHPGASKIHKNRTLPQGSSPCPEWGEEAMGRLASGPLSNFVDASSFLAAKGAYWRLHLATGRMFNEEYRRFGDWELITRATHFAGWRGKAIQQVVLDYYWGTPGQLQLTRAVNERVEAKVVK